MSNNSVSPGGNPFLGGQPIVTGSSPRPTKPSAGGVWLAVALSVLLNLAGLIGVAKFGWPAGNVLALFWIENVILGFWSLVRVATARGTRDGGSRIKPKGSGAVTSRTGTALFFCFHYGIFCLVHAVFTVIVANRIGFELSVAWVALPALLIMIRYAAETTATWFGSNGQRYRLSPQGAMSLPYPRIIVLHLALYASFALTINGNDGPGGMMGKLRDLLQPLEERLPLPPLDDGVRVILILILIKTAVDIKTTWTALHK